MTALASRTAVGVALVGLGLAMAVWSYNGYGGVVGCGTWALSCLYRALAWHFGIQVVATATLWWEACTAQRSPALKWTKRALAIVATLVLLSPAMVLASVFLL